MWFVGSLLCLLSRFHVVLVVPGLFWPFPSVSLTAGEMSRGVEFYWMKVVPFPRRSLNPLLFRGPLEPSWRRGYEWREGRAPLQIDMDSVDSVYY